MNILEQIRDFKRDGRRNGCIIYPHVVDVGLTPSVAYLPFTGDAPKFYRNFEQMARAVNWFAGGLGIDGKADAANWARAIEEIRQAEVRALLWRFVQTTPQNAFGDMTFGELKKLIYTFAVSSDSEMAI